MARNNAVPTFVKWAGGKKQLLRHFKSFFPDEFNKYFEPFVGSGAVFFYIKESYSPDECKISDSNEELINCYIQIRDNLYELIGELKNHQDNFLQFPYENKEKRQNYYYSIRAENTSELDNVEKASRFIFLNRTCFNGLYRVNPRGKFNVPMGRYKKPKILNIDKLEKAHSLLQDVEIKVQDFEDALKDAGKRDFIYLDPPYYPLNKTSNFTSYTKEVFLEDEQKRLAQNYNLLNEKGCKLMLSNSDTPIIYNLYDHGKYQIEKIKARRAINSNAKKRGAINELIIVNY